MTTHAKLSPSKRGQWKLCPGSIREQAKFPETGGGPAAIDGTHTHTLLEHCIKANLSDPTAMIGVKMKDHEGEFTIDVDRAARAQMAINYVKSIVETRGPNVQVLSESRVDPQWFLGRVDMAGTVDIQVFSGDTVEVIDYKDGIGFVDVVENDQLVQYAMGMLAGFRLPINAQFPFKWVKMTIIQPKLAMKNMQPITSYEVTVQHILDKIPTLVVEAAATDAPDAPLVPGESQCKYCRAKGSCAALAGNVMKEIGIMFQPIVQPTLDVLDVAQQSASQDPNTMSDQKLREIMEAAPLMRQLLEAVDAEVLRRFNAGVSIPGLKAVHGRGSRVWSLPEDQIADKLIKMGIPKGSVYETKLVSPAKAEKLTWEKTKAGVPERKQLSDRQLKTLESENVVKMAGKLTIVPESDSRPAVILNAAPMFSAVEAAVEVEALPSWLIVNS